MKQTLLALSLFFCLANSNAQTPCSQNLILNGDFELGNSYFSSDYTYDATSSLSQIYNTVLGLPYTPSPYGKHYNVYNIKSNFYDQDTTSDHTTFVNINPVNPPDFIPYAQRGDGKALAIRGENETLNYPSNTPGDVWYQHVNLKANTNYDFRAYYCPPAAGYPAYPFNNLVFQLYVNGVKTGETSYARYTDPYITWSKANFTFNSGANTVNTKISIKAFYADPSGGSYTATATPDTDQLFFIDDISLTGCVADEGIIGYVYNDLNANCLKDAGEIGIQNIQVKLYDNLNTIIAQTNTNNNGLYTFVKPAGTYTVVIDTMGTSYKTLCSYPGIDTTISIVSGSAQQNVNFPLVCKTGFDIGVKSIGQIGNVIKGITTYILPDVGFINNMGCTSAIGGQVVVKFSGPISYVPGPYYISSASQSIPTLVGNTLTYTVTDFSTLTSESFLFAINTLSNAIIGSPVCFSVTVIPTIGDYNPSNNAMQQCLSVNLNPYATTFEGITGRVYNDNNNNCVEDAGDTPLTGITVSLYNNSNVLIEEAVTSNGNYLFAKPAGTYKVVVDTLGLSYRTLCLYPGADSLVTVVSNTNSENINFPLVCKPSFDIGVSDLFLTNCLRPGKKTWYFADFGQMVNWFNPSCITGLSGQVKIEITGPVVYSGAWPTSLIPTAVGNVLTYTVADFSTAQFGDFFFSVTTDTNAPIGAPVCISATATPIVGDFHPGNNTSQHCYTVSNSFDPNYKQTYPIDVQPNYNDWFTYGIHFQNTGTAPAIDIVLKDTLDANLDLETFQLMSSTHLCTANVIGNVLTVNYQNILLPDSTSDYYGSQGFVQYRIKPKSTWASPAKIKNTAYIYFDYNAPIATNSTYNSILLPTGLKDNTESLASIYPNPTNGSFIIELATKEKQTLELFDITGRLVHSQFIENGKANISVSHLSAGIYNLSIKGNGIMTNKKLVIVK